MEPSVRPIPSLGRAFALYNVGRLLLFAAATVLLFGVFGINGPLLLLLALIVSAVLSIFVLRRQREDLGRALEARVVERTKRRADLQSRMDETDPQ